MKKRSEADEQLKHATAVQKEKLPSPERRVRRHGLPHSQ